MDKLKVDIINDKKEGKIHVSIDHGEFHVIKSNIIIQLFLRMIKNPERYRIDICE